MQKTWFLFLSIFLSQQFYVLAQQLQTYRIEFSDKGSYTYNDVQLSAKSLLRRTTQDIELNHRDIPVFADYINAVSTFQIEIIFASRWSNSLFVKSTPDQIAQIKQLPFVNKVARSKKIQSTNTDVSPTNFHLNHTTKFGAVKDYGFSDPQITQLEGKILHQNGYFGEDMTIAVFDAGFFKVNEHPVFKKAFEDNRIIAGPDFVRGHNTLVNYTFSAHGEMVLSTMAGFIEGTYIGTAPEANYILIRTEDAPTEKIIEEYYWLQAAEYADSIGVDMINSSLGYTVFNDTLDNHTYEQMNGDYTLITKAADWAAQTGILVVNSAGNSGASTWYYIGAPADGDSVFSIGAVDIDGISADFSSHGPTFDGRVKPNVVAHGAGVYVASGLDGYGPSNGTSFSGPIVCGMTACLWQYLKTVNPNISNMDIIQRVEESASLYPGNDENYGYGIPDYTSIVPDITPYELPKVELGVYPNPFSNELIVHENFKPGDKLEIYTSSGKLLFHKTIQDLSYSSHITTEDFTPGIYFIAIKSKDKNNVFKAIK